MVPFQTLLVRDLETHDTLGRAAWACRRRTRGHGQSAHARMQNNSRSGRWTDRSRQALIRYFFLRIFVTISTVELRASLPALSGAPPIASRLTSPPVRISA